MTDAEFKHAIHKLWGEHGTFQHEDDLRTAVMAQLHADIERTDAVLTAIVLQVLGEYDLEHVARFIRYLDLCLGYAI